MSGSDELVGGSELWVVGVTNGSKNGKFQDESAHFISPGDKF